MKLLVRASSLGAPPYFIAADRTAHGPTIRGLLARPGSDGRELDPAGLRSVFERRPDGRSTCFRAARFLPAGCDLYRDEGGLSIRERALPEPEGEILPLLERVLEELLSRNPRTALALSGGVDSALVLALARRSGSRIPVFTLATGIAGYCELEETLHTARRLEAGAVEVVEARVEDLVSALPPTIAAAETPLYNLHPVSRLILARAIRRAGFEALLTGDGADEVFAGADGRDYLPVVGALTRSCGLRLLSPFLDDRVLAWSRRRDIDPGKGALRRAALAVLPAEVAGREKRPRMAPDFDLSRRRNPALERSLAPILGRSPPPDGAGPEQTLWATTAVLLSSMALLSSMDGANPCAASPD